VSLKRKWLYVLAFAWFVNGVSYLGVSSQRRWAPNVVGFLGIGCAACLVLVALRPRTVFAYRFGGTLAIGSLLFRCASVILGLFTNHDSDAVWISMSAVGTTLMLCSLYWTWWLDDVKEWHERQKRSA
jgi:hypothetical protein